MFCPKCGTQVEEGSAHCGSCGAQLQQPQEPVKDVENLGKGAVVVIVALGLAVAVVAVLLCLGTLEVPGPEETTDYTAISNRVHGVSKTVKDGDWIYYVPSSETFEGYDSDTIWRVRSNGEGAQPIYVPQVPSEYMVALNDLYIHGERLYFTQNAYSFGYDEGDDNASVLTSMKLDGSDMRKEMPITAQSSGIQIVGNMVYFANNRAVFSKPLNSEERARVAQLKSEYDNWVIADGYVYVSSYDDGRSTLTRTSLEDGAAETIYSDYDASPEYFTPFKGYIYFAKRVDSSSGDYRKEIVRLDPETGDEDVLFKESRDDQDSSIWTISDKGLMIALTEPDKSTTIHVAALDGSNDAPAYTYDGDWAGNPLRTRNVGGSDEAYLAEFCVIDDELYFWPKDLDVEYKLFDDDPDKPLLVSLCKLNLDKGELTQIVTSSSQDAPEPTESA